MVELVGQLDHQNLGSRREVVQRAERLLDPQGDLDQTYRDYDVHQHDSGDCRDAVCSYGSRHAGRGLPAEGGYESLASSTYRRAPRSSVNVSRMNSRGMNAPPRNASQNRSHCETKSSARGKVRPHRSSQYGTELTGANSTFCG